MAKRPDWTNNAPFKFTNEYGEEWFARVEADGSVVITGSDVDWEEKKVDLDFGCPYVMHQAERLWLEAVVLAVTATDT
jgi:hypothetical protein